MTSSAAKQTDDLIRLFSTTLTSLTEDALAVKQASSLKECITDTRVDSQEFADQLWQLEDLVAALEEKVTALRQIVSEEKRSISKFESNLQQESQEQNALLDQMLQALEDHERQHAKVPAKSRETEIHHDDDSLEGQYVYSDEDSGCRSRVSQSSSGREESSRRDSMDPRARENLQTPGRRDYTDDDPITLPRITQEELEAYKAKNMQAPRISLIDLNEALEEIENVVHVQRHATQVLRRKKQHTGLTSSALQRRYDYLQKRQQILSEESSITSITEQDLRENCAFFRHGESTARATLSLLCRLRRLKQIPAKNRQVVYHLLL